MGWRFGIELPGLLVPALAPGRRLPGYRLYLIQCQVASTLSIPSLPCSTPPVHNLHIPTERGPVTRGAISYLAAILTGSTQFLFPLFTETESRISNQTAREEAGMAGWPPWPTASSSINISASPDPSMC